MSYLSKPKHFLSSPLNHSYFPFFYLIKWNVFFDSLFIYIQEEIIFVLLILFLFHSCPISFVKNLSHIRIVCYCIILPFLSIRFLLLYFHISFLNLIFQDHIVTVFIRALIMHIFIYINTSGIKGGQILIYLLNILYF